MKTSSSKHVIVIVTIIYSLIVGSCVKLFAQETAIRCGSEAHNRQLELLFPSLKQDRLRLESEIQDYQLQSRAGRITEQTIRIPVAVHVFHNNSSGFIGGVNNANISDEQIISQIKVLNEDYRKQVGTNGYNTNPVGADMNIEFYLATRDPQGNASNGITRHFQDKADYDPYIDWTPIAEIVSWSSDCYLNIWVVPMQGNTLAIAQFPSVDGGVTGLNNSTAQLGKTDGILVNHQVFGTVGTAITGKWKSIYNLGRTTTHEIGHWLGMFHPSGDAFCGTDFCDDTPPTEKQNEGTTCNEMKSTCAGKQTTNMIENFMDFSPDRCMNIFTLCQKSRSRAVFDRSFRRKKLLTCASTLPASEQLQVKMFPNPASSSAVLEVLLKGTQNITIELLDMTGKNLFTDSYVQVPSSSLTLRTDMVSDGLYIVRVKTDSETVTQRLVVVR